jgi:hypothetical protein
VASIRRSAAAAAADVLERVVGRWGEFGHVRIVTRTPPIGKEFVVNRPIERGIGISL